MKLNITKFQKYCEKALGKLTAECVESFKECKDDISRIQLIYDVAKQIPLGACDDSDKCFSEAENQKNEGNRCFAKKDYENAFICYNSGIIKCPQESVADRELLTILVSNRSATNFELGKYRRVLDDIDYIIEIGDYPNHLKHKIWFRKAKCYDALRNKKLALEAYNEALKCIKQSNLKEDMLKTKLGEIEKAMAQCGSNINKPNQDLIPAIHEERFLGGDEFVAANPKITICQDNYQGRYAMAVEDINAGTILVEENAFCSVVDRDHTLTNCQNCLESVELPIACPGCVDVIFCSTHCSRAAARSFHAVECGFQKKLFSSGASVNCLLAMRIISQKPLQFFLEKRNKLKDNMKDSCKKNVVRKKVYRSDDYDNVFFLCRNEALRKKEELIHYACMAVYLLRILKHGYYFGEFEDDVLTEDENFLGGLILRHLQILQFNAHEISELQNATKKESNIPLIMATNFENVTIGAGLYPTLALFNHSCDPSIVRYNIKNKIIVHAIKPIKANDIVYENYGPLYMSDKLEKRQEELKANYWFECLCQPCTELWPTFSEMKENELRIPCKSERCPYVFTVKDQDDPILICPYCKNATGLFPYLKGLMQLEEILPEAEYQLSIKQYKNALSKFLQALEILFKYSRSPHPEIIKVQQRVRTCMLQFGNKSRNNYDKQDTDLIK